RGLNKFGSSWEILTSGHRFVLATTSKTQTGFNLVNLISQLKQIDKQKIIVEYKYIGIDSSVSRKCEQCEYKTDINTNIKALMKRTTGQMNEANQNKHMTGPFMQNFVRTNIVQQSTCQH
ncbi:hypothetical protein RDWZM_007456, partial [Blomia tropicalis]